MSKWHEGLSDNQIEALKGNLTPYGLCWNPTKSIFPNMPPPDRELYDGVTWTSDSFANVTPLSNKITYRLRPDWTRPEKKKSVGRWEYCDVFVTPTVTGLTRQVMVYHFIHDEIEFSLGAREGMVGYSGIEFEEQPGVFFDEMRGVTSKGYACPLFDGDCVRPAVPVRVRFWRED